ncbi:MAG: ribbon-helix-helix domain-containing protein [Actinomycetota bacterium]|nr:ribbon-helix-helix domain-containing protein [Actinomycetota bacterium]
MSKLSSSPPEGARFTHRLQVHEDPNIAEQIRKLSRDSGRSLAAEVRAAIRYWLQANEGVENE